MSEDKNSDANPKDLASTIASWLKNVEHQGFLPTSYYDEFNNEEESSSEESESESEDEIPYSQFRHFGKASQASMKRYSCIMNLKDEFVVEDPFVEVKDEDIKSVETDFNDDGTRIIHLKNGLMLWGKFRRKRRYGLGSITGAPLEAKGIKLIWGRYKGGVLEGAGKVQLMDETETVLHGNFVKGKLHGNVRGLTFKEGQLTFIGKFKNGRPSGKCWKSNDPGRSWLYGSIDSRGRCSGFSNAFIYPDLNTILLGHMQDENMVKAHESSIVGLTMKSGMLYLKFRYISGPEYKFCPSTLNKVRCNWLQDDPYERKIVYSGPSRMGDHAGDGLFLRKDVPAGTVIAFYNGIRVQPGEIPPFRSNAYQIFLDWKPKYTKERTLRNNGNKDSRCDRKSNPVEYYDDNEREYLDIPPECVSLENYRASLGHKINHSFQPNCKWDQMLHPIFGRIPSVITLVDLKAETELTCHYMIDMQEAAGMACLEWYIDLWDKFSSQSEKGGAKYNNTANERTTVSNCG